MFDFIPEEQLRKIVFSLVVLFVTYIVSWVVKKSIDILLKGVNRRFAEETFMARTRTITSLFNNLIDITVFLIGILIILSYWDINIMPLLTGAGLAGLAISFGAQTLVKDIISGFFIFIEDQYSVGDTVKIAGVEGTVVRVTLRLTVLRDKKGNFVYIPNSQITTVVRK